MTCSTPLIPGLVETKPRTLSGLMPWEWLRDRLVDQSPRELRALLEAVRIDVVANLRPCALGIREQYVGAQAKRTEELLKAALMVGKIKAFAGYPIRNTAFAIKAFAWGPVPLDHHDSYRSINEGVLLVDGSVYPEGSLDRRLANAPLFVAEREANAWCKLKPPSEASLRKVANDLIEGHRKDRPDVPMRKLDFLDIMKKHFPPASGRQLKALWGETVPDNWKRSGTKSRPAEGESDR
jgi:hypothetical protein